MNPKRHYNKWTVNELLQLQREYELLNWSIPDIAKNHERTEDSILYKLHEEELMDSLERSILSKTNFNKKKNQTNLKTKNNQTNLKTKNNENILLNQRVVNLESSIVEMKTMVKQMVDKFMEQKREKTNNRQPLRKYQPLKQNQ